MLAWIVIIVTATAGDIPVGTEYVLAQPQECNVMAIEIALVESLGGKADGFCLYTHAPVRSLRPKQRPTDLMKGDNTDG